MLRAEEVSALKVSEVTALFQLMPDMEAVDNINPLVLWQAKLKYLGDLKDALRNLSELPVGTEGSQERLLFDQAVVSVKEIYADRNASDDGDHLMLIEAVNNFARCADASQGKAEQDNAGSKIADYISGFARTCTVLTSLESQLTSKWMLTQEVALSKYRCVLSGQLLIEPVSLSGSSGIFFSSCSLNVWIEDTKALIREHFSDQGYQHSGIDQFFFDPLTCAGGLTYAVHVKAALSHKKNVERYKKALVIQTRAEQAVNAGNYVALSLLMQVQVAEFTLDDEPHEACIDKTWEIHVPTPRPGEAAPRAPYNRAHYTAAHAVFLDLPPAGATRSAEQMRPVLKKKLGLTTKMREKMASLTPVESVDDAPAPARVQGMPTTSDWMYSELDYVIQNGIPDASLDLYIAAIEIYFAKKHSESRGVGTSESVSDAEKVLALLHEQLSRRPEIQNRDYFYVPKREDRSELLTKSQFSGVISEVSPIHKLLGQLYLLYQCKLSQLTVWSRRNLTDRVVHRATFGFGGDLARARRLSKKTEMTASHTSRGVLGTRDYFVMMLQSKVMLSVVRSDSKTGRAVRHVLTDLKRALQVGDPTLAAEGLMPGDQVLDATQGKAFLDVLPALLESYLLDVTQTEKLVMQSEKEKVVKDSVTPAMLRIHLGKLSPSSAHIRDLVQVRGECSAEVAGLHVVIERVSGEAQTARELAKGKDAQITLQA